jgi:chromate transport protein ChrA
MTIRFSDIVTLCQFLPGPRGSEVGFGIGRLAATLPVR